MSESLAERGWSIHNLKYSSPGIHCLLVVKTSYPLTRQLDSPIAGDLAPAMSFVAVAQHFPLLQYLPSK